MCFIFLVMLGNDDKTCLPFQYFDVKNGLLVEETPAPIASPGTDSKDSDSKRNLAQPGPTAEPNNVQANEGNQLAEPKVFKFQGNLGCFGKKRNEFRIFFLF